MITKKLHICLSIILYSLYILYSPSKLLAYISTDTPAPVPTQAVIYPTASLTDVLGAMKHRQTTIPPKSPINNASATSSATVLTARNQLKVELNALGFRIPTMGEILTFIVRLFFVVGGLISLLFLLMGALAWVTSSGEKEKVTKARNKIQAAIIGVILMVIVLAVIWTMEQVVFARKICFGISCPATIPALIEPCNSKSCN
jgi:hypothetical protein